MAATDETLMPYGKFKGEALANVPAWYLLYMYDQNKLPQNIRDYVDENREILDKEKAEENQKKNKSYGK